MGRHVMECLGKTRVVIEDGKVVEVGEPRVKCCPLFKKYRGIDELNKDTIKENIEYRINKFGMCTENRETRMKDFLNFGISEILSLALKEKKIDAFKWAWLDERTFFDIFSIEAVFAYFCKLEMLERWEHLDVEEGKETFKQIIENLRGEAKVPEEFVRK